MKNNEKNRKRDFMLKALSLIFALTVVLGAFTIGGSASAASVTDKTFMAGADGIGAWNSTKGYDYIYMGKDGTKPVKWRVLDTKTNTGDDSGIFVLTEYVYSRVRFRRDDATVGNSYDWAGSNAQTYCKGFLSTSSIIGVLEITKSDAAYTSSTNSQGFFAADNILVNEKIFYLSAEEAENPAYGFINDESRRGYTEYGANEEWWLRSPAVPMVEGDDTQVGLVSKNGAVTDSWIKQTYGPRYAVNIDKSRIILISAASGGKSTGALGTFVSPSAYSQNEWKLTVSDPDRESFKAECTSYQDGVVTISYLNATIGENEYISALIMDNASGEYTKYAKIADLSESTAKRSGTVTLDISGIDFTKNSLYIINEQANEDYFTDFSSVPQEVLPITIENKHFNVDLTSVTYTGEPIIKTVSIKLDGFGENDYTVEHLNNINAGKTATVRITGKGLLKGTLDRTFTIKKADPTVTWPEDIFNAVAGTRLTALTLDSGFVWTNSGTVLVCGENDGRMYYFPPDSTNYNTLTNTIKIYADHNMGEPTYEWNEDHTVCTATRVCLANSEHVETEAGAVISEVTQEQSCILDELATFTATFENPAFSTAMAENIKTADAHGHDFESGDEYIGDGYGHKIKCIHCEEYSEPFGHRPNDDDRNCTTSVLCSVCDYAVINGNASHSFSTDYPLNSATADKHYRICTVAGCDALDAGETHSPATDNGDCMTDILCTECSYVLTEGNDSHSFSEEYLKDADGHWHKCKLCNVTDTKSGHDSPADDGDCTTAIVCKCKHILKAANESHSGGSASCTEKAKCAECSKEYGEPLGHAYGEWTQTVAPSCTEAGEEKRVCENDSEHTEKRSVEALGHDFANNNGYTSTDEGHSKICARCDVTEAAEEHSYTDGVCDCGKEKPGLSGGAVAAISAGSAAAVGIGVFALIWFAVKKKSFGDLLGVFKR